MKAYDPDMMSREAQLAFADRVTMSDYIAQRPVYVVGPLVIWWSLGPLWEPVQGPSRLRVSWLGRKGVAELAKLALL